MKKIFGKILKVKVKHLVTVQISELPCRAQRYKTRAKIADCFARKRKIRQESAQSAQVAINDRLQFDAEEY